MTSICIKKLNETAHIPFKAHENDAGYDLLSTEEYELMPMERKAFKTGLAMAIPSHLYGRIAPRSGLAIRQGLEVMGGVVDSTYRGEIMAILVNLGNSPVKINIGDKIAQIIFEYYTTVIFNQVETLDDTSRGTAGFGSTGMGLTDVKSIKGYVDRHVKTQAYPSKYEDVIKGSR